MLPPPGAPATTPGPAVIPPSQVPAAQAGLPPGSVPDPWITYDRPGCCGPLGADGPIDSELYTRNGISIPMGPSIIRNHLNTGWFTEFGGRSLFFNRDTDAAWTADIGLSYQMNDAGPAPVFTLLQLFNVTSTNNVFQTVNTVEPGPVRVQIRDYQRVAFNLAGGREWYIGAPAEFPGRHWRIGADIGGRWGTSRLDLNDITRPEHPSFRHVSDVYGSVVLSIHSDWDFQIGPRSWFLAGLRAEWAYNWSDILRNAASPNQTSDTQEVNILMNFGWRF
jgi:hypothetical protein